MFRFHDGDIFLQNVDEQTQLRSIEVNAEYGFQNFRTEWSIIDPYKLEEIQ